jgi:hypothetical protein
VFANHFNAMQLGNRIACLFASYRQHQFSDFQMMFHYSPVIANR